MNTRRRSIRPSPKGLCILIIIALIMVGCSSIAGLKNGEPDLYFQVQSKDGSGIMNCSGKWIVGPVERTKGLVNGPMVNGLAPFINIRDGYETFINADGEFPFEKYDRVMQFSEGLAAVMVDDKWGFIDTTGAFVIQPRFLSVEVGSFYDGLANVAIEATDFGMARSWIFIDPKGEQVLGPYQGAASFSDGYAAVWGFGEEHLSGYIDTKGEFVLKFTQEDRYSPAGAYGDGLFPVVDVMKQLQEGTCSRGYMDQEGGWVIDPAYCHVGAFHDGLAPVSRSEDSMALNGFGYINSSGEMVIGEQYQFASDFSGGCARVAWDNFRGFGLIDTKGEFIYKYETGE